MTMAHDLLDEPLLTWRDPQRHRGTTTLPGMIAKLASGDLADFSRARAHQFHPWSMFLTQLAAIALRRAGKSDPALSAKDWRSLLLDLTGAAHEPWCLVVEDLTKPAFFQPPVPVGSMEGWKGVADHPDDIDVLVTSKGHDVKSSLVSADDTESWVFALATLQTMQGYPGRGYNRVARMKGGYGSRPRVGISPGRTLTQRFLRDTKVLLDSWDRLLERGYSDSGQGLTWTLPWDGKAALPMSELSPHFVEVCWRLRCQKSLNGLTCAYTTTEGRRCLPEIENGDVGDPWVPVEREDGGALTVGGGGFHYQLLSRLLFEGDFEPAAAQVIKPSDPDPLLFLASVMARGQGKTEGLHERELVLSGSARKRLGAPDTRAVVGARAGNNVEQAKKMRSKVLFPALKKLARGETVPADEFDIRVDEVFFGDLFASLEQEEDRARLEWDRRLNDIAWKELQHAINRCCVPSARWHQAVSDAEGMFHACRSKQFPTLVASFESEGSQGAES